MSRSSRKTYHHGNLRNAILEAAQRLLESDGAAALNFRRLADEVGVSHAAPLAHFPDRLCLDASIAAQGFRRLSARLENAAEPAAQRDPSRLLDVLNPLLESDRDRPQPAAPEWRLASYVRDPNPPISPRLPASLREKTEVGEYGASLIAASLAYLRFALERPGLYRAMYAPNLAEGMSEPAPRAEAQTHLRELQEAKAKAISVFVDLVARGQKAGQFRREIPAERAARLFTALAEGLADQYLEERPRPGLGRLKDAEQLFELLLRALAH